MDKSNFLLLAASLDEPILVADAAGELIWESSQFKALVAPFGRDYKEEIIRKVVDNNPRKETDSSVAAVTAEKTLPLQMPHWQGEVRLSVCAWDDRQAVIAVFKGYGSQTFYQTETRRREALRHLSGAAALTAGDFHAACKLITETAVKTLGAARIGIWRIDEDINQLVNEVAYSRTLEDHLVIDPFGPEVYPEYISMLHTERNIVISDTATDTILPGLSNDYNFLGVNALLDCPIRVGGKLAGAVCIESDAPRNWTMEEQAFGASVADFVVIAMESSRVYESERRMATLMSNLPGTAFRCCNDFPTFTMEYMSEGCLEMTGYHPEDIVGNNKLCFFDIVHPEDLPKLKADNEVTLLVDEPLDTTFRIIHKSGDIR